MHVELAVLAAVDDADVAHPDLAAVPRDHPVLDRHLAVGLAQLVEGGEEARQVERLELRSQKSAAANSSGEKPKSCSICGLTKTARDGGSSRTM